MKLKLIFMAVDALFLALLVSMGVTFKRSAASGGFAVRLLPGMKRKSMEALGRYDVCALCADLSATLFTCAGAFILAVILDAFRGGIGLAVGVVLSAVALFLLRRKMGADYDHWKIS